MTTFSQLLDPIPVTVVFFGFAIVALAMHEIGFRLGGWQQRRSPLGVVGYSGGLTRRRSVVNTVMLVVALGTVLTLVIDLDRPREGFLQVSQQPLIDLHDLGNPRP